MSESRGKRGWKSVLAVTVPAAVIAVLAPVIVTCALVLYTMACCRGKRPRVTIASGFGGGRSRVKTMSELMGMLEAIPFRRGVPLAVAFAVYTLLDVIPMLLNTGGPSAGFVYPYPDVFEPVMLESQDGTPLYGMLAMQQGESRLPALVFVHGLFGSKNSFNMLTLATRAYYDWGFHVLALDLRNHGDSARFSEAPTSWGFRESDDILAAAEYLDSLEWVSTVGVCGGSMGASSSLLAAGRSRLDGPLAGGVLSINGYADADRITRYISTREPGSVESFLNWLFFCGMLAAKTLLCGPRLLGSIREYTRQVASQYYEITEEELYKKASPVNSIGDIEVPCLILHSLDDNVVPVAEADDLVAAAKDNPMVGSLIVPRGGHGMYQFTNPRWFYESVRTFFSYWGECELGPELSPDRIDSIPLFGNPNN